MAKKTTKKQPDQAKNEQIAPRPQLIQLTRNVGGHLFGETFRVTPQEAQGMGFNEADYQVIDEEVNVHDV